MPLQSFLCKLFTSEDHDLPTWPKPSIFNSRQVTVKFPLFYPAKTPKEMSLIGRVLGEELYSPGDQALLFRWGWVCLSLTQPVLQPECERDVWMGHKQWLFCGHTGDWSFRALQAQPVIFRPGKPVAHPTCIEQAIELHAGPLYCVLLWKQSHTLTIEVHSPAPLH